MNFSFFKRDALKELNLKYPQFRTYPFLCSDPIVQLKLEDYFSVESSCREKFFEVFGIKF